MSSTNPERDLTPAEIGDLERLEALARQGLGTYVHVGNALAQIRDRHLYRGSHASFEAYLRERWGVNMPNGDPMSQALGADASTLAGEPEPRAAVGTKPCEALARACEKTLSALDGAGRLDIEIRLAVREQLRDDVLFLGAELAVVKALLAEVIDWDSELTRLLDDELPPLDPDTDPEGDE
jgi:hypothetical protein